MAEKPRKRYDIKNFSNYGKFEQKRDRKPRREPDPPGLAVTVHGDDVMKAYRRLKKKMLKDNLMDTIRDKRYYRKPSEIRQERIKKERRAAQKNQKDRAMEYGIRYKNYDPNSYKQRGY
jgi:ribosomal protein S21